MPVIVSPVPAAYVAVIVVDCPTLIDAGEAEMVAVGGGMTVTDAHEDQEPLWPVELL